MGGMVSIEVSTRGSLRGARWWLTTENPDPQTVWWRLLRWARGGGDGTTSERTGAGGHTHDWAARTGASL